MTYKRHHRHHQPHQRPDSADKKQVDRQIFMIFQQLPRRPEKQATDQ